VQGMNAALTEKPDLIDLMGGNDPRQMVPQVRAALAAGIPITVTHASGLDQTPMLQRMGVDDVAFDFHKAGALLVDWAVVHTQGKLDAIVVISTGPLATDTMLPGIESELKHCPKCKIHVINVPVADWSTRITPNVQAMLLSHPEINYIIPLYDSMSQFVVPAVTLTNSADRVKIASFNGTPFVLGLVQQGRCRWISARTSTGSAMPSSTPRCASSVICRKCTTNISRCTSLIATTPPTPARRRS
jgi:ribose transport system substrate-binding protein